MTLKQTLYNYESEMLCKSSNPDSVVMNMMQRGIDMIRLMRQSTRDGKIYLQQLVSDTGANSVVQVSTKLT
jgi:hypothetical protein